MALKITINDSVIFNNSVIVDTDFDDVMLATEVLHWAAAYFNTHGAVTKVEVERV